MTLKHRQQVRLSRLAVIVFIIGFNAESFAQQMAPPPSASKSYTVGSSPVVIKASKLSVTLDEFEHAYMRMNDKNPFATTLDSLKDFLGIYADYRLKLLEAADEGLAKDPKIVSEMDGYRKMLAGPYVLDKMLTDPALSKLYERRKYEVEGAHFLAKVHNWNDPSDTLRAYNRALKALARLNDGESLAMIVLSAKQQAYLDNPVKARKDNIISKKAPLDSNEWVGSDDQSTISEGGSLGWFTGGMTIRPFEDAVYSLSPGEYVHYPVKSKFGYHVVYLLGKRIRLGGIHVHHILIAMPSKTKGDDTLSFYHRADSLLRAIRAGAKFENVAKASSDDKGSADLGGDLGVIDHENRRSERPFDDASFFLKDGEISGIVRTTKGYHIIRRDSVLPPRSFDQDRDMLKKMYKNYYFSEDRDKLSESLRKQNNVHIDSLNVNTFMTRIDSSRTSVDTNWAKQISPGERGLVAFTFGNTPFKIQALVDSLSAQPGYPLARNQIYDFINKQIDILGLASLSKDVSKKYPDFDSVMADYENGIMLFELESRRVWNQVKPDSIGEAKFYGQHLSRFMWPERIDVSEIYLLSDSSANAMYKRIRDNAENFDTLATRYTERPGYKPKAGHWGLMTKDENEISRKAFPLAVDDVSQPFSNQAGYSLVKVNRRIPITQKTFSEARQEVASQYQDEASSDLRLKWVEELRTNYHLQLVTKPLEDEYNRRHSMSSVGK